MLAVDERRSDQSPDEAGSPYPGLRPFTERESRQFFGREREIGSILALLEEQQLVVVHGASGCGKSSIVRAGVVPVFRRDALANSLNGRVIVIRPGDAGGPLRSLARKLEREFPLSGAQEGIAKTEQSWSRILAASPDWKRDICSAVDAANATLCIVIDQFEEIFAVNREGRSAEVRRVIEFLVSLDERAPEGTGLGKRSLCVILTMRSDYLGHCAIWEGFAEAVNRSQYLLPRISNVGLLRSIHESGRRNGVTVEDDVADRLLAVVTREMDGLPIVQHALMRAWQFARTQDGRRIINMEALENEKVGGAERALSLHADEAFRKATKADSELEQITDWIFQALSDLDSDGRIIRRSPTLSQLASETGAEPSQLGPILDVFRDRNCGLIMPSLPEPLDAETKISVSHEALLRQWQRINNAQFDKDGRPVGLVYREFQDGMIWRSLLIQAQIYARDGTSVLGAAATEQRLPWYEEIEARPRWIARHETGELTQRYQEAEEHWALVANFMQASGRNLKREQKLLVQSQQNQRVIGYLLALSILLLGVAVYDGYDRVMQARAGEAKAAADAKTAQVALYSLRAQSANMMAQRDCAGLALSGKAEQDCFLDTTKKYIARMEAEAPKVTAETAAAKLFSIQSQTASEMARRDCADAPSSNAAKEQCINFKTAEYLGKMTPNDAVRAPNSPTDLPVSPYGGGFTTPPAQP